ncbi:MAG: hypothetical protein KGI37_07830 [Alphaproteobacteria bacterium]|nr:hypothetical protein [Alphaproteobacteria bacterium]
MNPITKIAVGIGAVLAIIIVGVFIWLFVANANLKAQLAQSQSDATACHMANQDFADKAAVQNKAIAALQAAADARARRAAAADKAAQKQAQGLMKRAAHIAAAKSGPDACAAANNLMNAYIGGE